jgi:hypothetical protein
VWFTEHREKLSWSSPLERTVYAMGLFTMFWIVAMGEILQFLMGKQVDFNISLLPFVILGLAIMALYKYVYITKARYELILSANYRSFTLKSKTGVTIFIIFAFFSTLLPFITFAWLS